MLFKLRKKSQQTVLSKYRDPVIAWYSRVHYHCAFRFCIAEKLHMCMYYEQSYSHTCSQHHLYRLLSSKGATSFSDQGSYEYDQIRVSLCLLCLVVYVY